MAFQKTPQLVLLDRQLPDIQGLDVLRTLRANRLTRDIPVIMVTAMTLPEDRREGYEAEADAYITKPLIIEDLLAQVTALLRRHHRDVAMDPCSKLPGNALLRDELTKRLARSTKFTVLYADLSHFKPYVDRYGVEAASQVIEKLTEILKHGVSRFGSPKDFVGHIGGDDFLLLTSPKSADALSRYIVSEFEKLVSEFYDEADSKRGYFCGQDRYSVKRRFSFVGIDIAVVDIRKNQFHTTVELTQYLAKCKTITKKSGCRVRRFKISEKSS